MIGIVSIGIALTVALVWATIEVIEIEKEGRRRKAELDAWYEEELNRIKEMYKDVDEPHQITWDDYES